MLRRLLKQWYGIRDTVIAVAAVFGVLLTAYPAGAEAYEVAVLQGLDKVTARVSTIQAPVGDSVRFGTLDIVVHHCDKRPPEETPESAAFLDIAEIRPAQAAVALFRGWMFASSPALSSLEHPVYDIWVLDCTRTGDDDDDDDDDDETTP